ncbi:MAG: ApaG domain-containing protein [Cryomorphaceae bacterium]|nr:ApaG domain-containing protein [Cryomorphaceae bacterium]
MLTRIKSTSINVEFKTHFIGKYGLLYLFGCELLVKNNSTLPITIVGKHWKIFSNHSMPDEIIGEGFNGTSPVIKPFETFKYESVLPIHTVFAYIEPQYNFSFRVNKRKQLLKIKAKRVNITPKAFLN